MRKFLLPVIFISLSVAGFAQITPEIDIQGKGNLGARFIQTAVPYLTIAPDARAAGMADVGVATTADANATYWNAAKLVFAENPDGTLSDMGGSLSYTPWLRALIDDMSLNYGSFYKRLRKEEVVGVSLNFFNLGSMEFRDGANNSLGEGNPFELTFKVDYARMLSDNMSVSLGLKWIHSDITNGAQFSGANTARAGNSIAADLGFFWNNEVTIAGERMHLALGGNISNLGSKISYTNPEEAFFIPTNLRLGGALTKDIDLYNKITLAIDFNKLMVPSPAEYGIVDATGERVVINGTEAADKGLVGGIFGSFADAPGGFSEEISEFTVGSGIEYWYADAFAARAGYFHEATQKGGRQFFTLGAGVRWKLYSIDFAYMIPLGRTSSPLRDTIRLSLQAKFKSKKAKVPANGSTASL